MELEGDWGSFSNQDLPQSMGLLTLDGGRYAIYRMQGPYQSMPDHFMKLHEDWLPNSGKVADYSRPFLEIYLNNPNEVGIENALTDLCLPIREDL
jgi:AraC family transcriptional regulator